MHKLADRLSVKGIKLSWPIFAWIVAFSSIGKGDSMLFDPDTYWHIVTGNWILTNHAIPAVDFYSHSMAGTAWSAHEWLSEVILALLYSTWGWGGPVALTGICFAAVLTILCRFLLDRIPEPVHALIILGLAGGMLASHLLARPHMLAMPLLLIWLIGLVKAREQNRTPPLWLLLVMILWANLHGGFTLGLALAGAMGLEAVIESEKELRIRTAIRWLRFLVLSLLAAMVTPFQWEGIAFTFHILSLKALKSNIGEWRAPNFQEFEVFELWLLLLIVTLFVKGLKLGAVRILLVLGFIHMSLSHSRYMALTGFIVAVLIAQSAGVSWKRQSQNGDFSRLDSLFLRLSRRANGIAMGLVATLSCIAIGLMLRFNTFAPPAPFAPADGLAAIRNAHIQGPLFNSYAFGGFLIFSGEKVFIDGRADMYGDKFLNQYLDAISLKSAHAFTDLLEQYKIEATILLPETPPIALLDHLPGWKRIHSDKTSIVHIRTREAETP